MADALGLPDEANRYKSMLAEWPYFDTDEENCLTFAPGFPYKEFHRHFSHQLAFHPFGLIDWSHGDKEREIIRSTIKRLDEVGHDYWTGYSYSWLGNLKARAMDGEGVARSLRDFSEHFCLRNTFHVNGDQTKSGMSKYTYKPFTLEGNFAFASGLNEMLIQSHTGIVRIFPAVPGSWKDISFDKLRTVGAFLVSAEMNEGNVERVEILSETGGVFRMHNPFPPEGYDYEGKSIMAETGRIISINTVPGEKIILTLKI
jgi:alpha-L-fucosidase 2